MDPLERNALLVRLVKKLGEHGSWCGATHIQKAMYFLQEMLAVPSDFFFILYKHGPYSFTLGDELAAMLARGFLDLQIRSLQYGPSFVVGRHGDVLEKRYGEKLTLLEPKLEFLASKIGDKKVVELERIATALYVTRSLEENKEHLTEERRVAELTRIKPHISPSEAISAIETIDQWLTEVKERFPEQVSPSSQKQASNEPRLGNRIKGVHRG